jgi:hypothetical protein
VKSAQCVRAPAIATAVFACRRCRDDSGTVDVEWHEARRSEGGLIKSPTLEETMSKAESIPENPVKPTGCCPPFDPKPWQNQEIVWKDKAFVKDHVTCLFHVPLNMGQTVSRDMALIEAAQATSERSLMLSDERSPWGADIFIEVKKEVPGATMDHLSGTFLTRVFEGPFRDAGKWVKKMRDYVAERGRTLEKLYFGYTTCPKCAKAYGKNYVVLFAKVNEAADAKSSLPTAAAAPPAAS